jgi:NADH-quinone oxidoreductase subunit I
VEACPTEAITESKMFEFSFANRSDAIYTKTELVVGDDGKPKVLPWEDWREGDDVNTSAWMRATSPSGAVAYEDRPLWSGELGYGVREPEGGQALERADAAGATTAPPAAGGHGDDEHGGDEHGGHDNHGGHDDHGDEHGGH